MLGDGAVSKTIPAEVVLTEGGSKGNYMDPEIQDALTQLRAMVYSLLDRIVELNMALHTANNRNHVLEEVVEGL